MTTTNENPLQADAEATARETDGLPPGNSQHTSGPMFVGPDRTGLYPDPDGERFCIAIMDRMCPAYKTSEQDANAHLLAAAYTSYDKHCGPRAVECAEVDLLGKALEASRAIVAAIESWKTDEDGDWHLDEWLEREEYEECLPALRAVIAKATGQKP